MPTVFSEVASHRMGLLDESVLSSTEDLIPQCLYVTELRALHQNPHRSPPRNTVSDFSASLVVSVVKVPCQPRRQAWNDGSQKPPARLSMPFPLEAENWSPSDDSKIWAWSWIPPRMKKSHIQSRNTHPGLLCEPEMGFYWVRPLNVFRLIYYSSYHQPDTYKL